MNIIQLKNLNTMKQFLLFFSIICLTMSCSENKLCEDQNGNFYNCDDLCLNQNGDYFLCGGSDTNKTTYAQSNHISQVGPVEFQSESNTLNIPLRTKGISTNTQIVQIKISQGGQDLPGLHTLRQSGSDFITLPYQLPEDIILTGENIVVQLFTGKNFNSQRILRDIIDLN